VSARLAFNWASWACRWAYWRVLAADIEGVEEGIWGWEVVWVKVWDWGGLYVFWGIVEGRGL
jgi:hypothetical protein